MQLLGGGVGGAVVDRLELGSDLLRTGRIGSAKRGTELLECIRRRGGDKPAVIEQTDEKIDRSEIADQAKRFHQFGLHRGIILSGNLLKQGIEGFTVVQILQSDGHSKPNARL